MFPSASGQSPLTVSQLTSLLRSAIESSFPEVWLEGELSNLRAPGSGHLYCTLKDETSQIRAVLFRSSALRVKFALQEGMQVVVRGRLTVYEPRGEYQLIMEAVEPKGIGALQLAFEQLKQRLASEGLFDAGRKRPLPAYPSAVGLVTSLTGAAIRDMLTVLRRRWPLLRIVIASVPVQGEGAAEQIASAVDALNEQRAVDVIIVGRGGGSLEDLWSFNEEIVVRAIAQSKIPVVSAVGHEIDTTLADFAADYRAPTPSAAAEAVVPVLVDVMDRLYDLTNRVGQGMARQCQTEQRRLDVCRKGLASIRYRIQDAAQRTDDLSARLVHATSNQVAGWKNRAGEGQQALAGLNPIQLVRRGMLLVPQLMARLEQQVHNLTLQRRGALQGLAARLQSLSPLAVLGRGYSIVVRTADGSLVRRVGDVHVRDRIIAQFLDGRLACTVETVLPDRHSV